MFNRVTIKKEIIYRLADHEVLLSFFDDDGAEAFEEWWGEQGAQIFGDWVKTHPFFEELAKRQYGRK